jgi:hypothetical protein
VDHYDEIKEEDGLDVPQEYRRMCEEGLFSYFGEKKYEDMTADERVELMRERTLSGKLLYLHYIEWFTPIEGAGMVDGMVPFAGDGSGDQYCWYVPWAGEDGRVPVVYFEHEMWRVKGLAPDYTTWLYRMMLDELTHLDCEMFKPEEGGKLVAAYIEMVRQYLSDNQVKVLQEASERPLQRIDGECALISSEECHTMLQGQMDFKHLDVVVIVKPSY